MKGNYLPTLVHRNCYEETHTCVFWGKGFFHFSVVTANFFSDAHKESIFGNWSTSLHPSSIPRHAEGLQSEVMLISRSQEGLHTSLFC